MKRAVLAFVAFNRKAVLIFGVLIGSSVFGLISWQASAGSRDAKVAKDEKQLSDSNQARPSKAAQNELLGDDPSLIMLNAGAIDTKSVASKAIGGAAQESFGGKEMKLVKFAGPIQPKEYASLPRAGLEIVDYIPNYTYLVYGDAASINRAVSPQKNVSSIVWYGDFDSGKRINPNVYEKAKGTHKTAKSDSDLTYYTVQLYKDEAANASTLNLIESLQTTKPKAKSEYLRYVVTTVGLTLEGVEKLAKSPDVISIYKYLEPIKLDEHQDIILIGNLTGNVPTPSDYFAYLSGKGFTQAQFDASNFLVDLTDSGVDTATPASPNEFVFRRSGDPTLASRYIYSRLEGTPNSGSTLQGCDGHGNLNASIIAGYVPGGAPFNAAPHADSNGFRYGLGVAPFVKLGSSVIFDPDNFTSPVYANLQSKAYNDGARISSNSWGSNANTYNTDAQSYDALVRDAQPLGSTFPVAGNQEMVIVFAAGNNGENGSNTVGAPSTAKNVITVGASENVQAFGGQDQCMVTDAQADSAFDIIPFSSRGPTADGRKKPDIMLPGTHVSGTVAQATNVSPVSGNGAQLACFTAGGVCAGPGTSNFFPTGGQQWYTASSGTSHSTPAIAGYAALIRQDFINRGIAPPSPAMTKGLIMNTARYMNGVGANDSLPSNNQGMGLANFNNYFDVFAQSRIVRDELAADKFTASGQQRVFTGNIVSAAKPFRVTLAYSDAVGSTSGNAFVNNLDLEVTVGGNTYKGNVFTGANSVTGGTADTRNNVESVFIPAGVTGNFVIKVKATNIAGDGVPNNADLLDQDFALVASNANEAALAVVATAGSAVTAESCAPANSTIDPNETVTVNFSLQDVGTANTTNLVATLQPTGGVTGPSAAQNYGALTANGAAVSKPFTFSNSASCGTTITATFQLQDGASNLGTVTYTLQVGTPSVTTENFDTLTVPALPAGWVATNASGPAPLWITTATGSDTAPNNAFVDDPTVVSDKRLETSAFTPTTLASTVSFRNNFALENTYDGGVLEVSSPNINAGAYTDIIDPAVGGSFVSGGYTGTVSASSSAINGRQAWTGSSGGYIDTVANLGPNVVGQSIKLRFRMATDSSAALTGWHVDGVQILAGYACCGVAGTPIITSGGSATITAENATPPNNAPDPGETVTVNLPISNTGTGATANLVGTLQNTGGVTGASGPQNYGVVSPLSDVAFGPPVSRLFTFKAAGTCGSNITLTLALQDGATSYGNVSYTLKLGTTVTVTSFTQNFDTVVAPALPAGWTTTTTTGTLPVWVTSATTPDSAPNDAFASDIATVSNTELVTPTIAVPLGGGQLTFRNLFNMEASGTTPTTGYDGMVLEISVDGGAFSDIVTAGGSFAAGGYTRTIAAGFSSPIAGRSAWSGLSGGTTDAPTYITSAVTLPAAAAGHNIQLKWRDATDASDIAVGVAGVRIDGISISANNPVCSVVPTAAGVTVTGRVLTSDGRGVRGANVTMTDQSGNVRSAVTGAFGNYLFDDVEAGQNYVVGVAARRFSYSPRVLQVNDSITDFDFTPDQ